MKPTTIDGLQDMNAAYFLGYMAEDAPTVIDEDPVIAGAPREGAGAGAGAAAAYTNPTGVHSFRKRPRKQKMMSSTELYGINCALNARKEADEMKRKLATAQMQAAEVSKGNRLHRREALAQNQEAKVQLQQQQAQALEATRAAEKTKAAAARRAALEKKTLAVQQEGKAQMTYFVRVPKATIHTCKMGAESSEGEGNCGGQANQQMGPIAPSTPPKKAVRAIPSSPTTSSASAGAVGVKFCQCCFATSSPIWRRGGVQPYEGLTVCNACGMWELHHCKSLVHSDKENKHRGAFLAEQGKMPATSEHIPNMPVKAQKSTTAQVAAPQQARGTGHNYGTRSRQPAVAAAAAGGDLVQQNSSNMAETQPIQQVRSGADMGSGAEAPPATRKRKAANGDLQLYTLKRSKTESACSHDPAIAKEGSGGLEDFMDEDGANAAGGFGGGESDRMALDGAPATVQQRRALRLRKGKGIAVYI